jgi:hypothetical protein
MVIDAKPVNTFSDTMRTYLYPAGTKYDDAHSNSDPGIPVTHRHIRLSYALEFRPKPIVASGESVGTIRASRRRLNLLTSSRGEP